MRILIVTYTYPPSTSVNGFRPYYFAKTLQEAGHSITILTRHFTGNETHASVHDENNTPIAYTREEGCYVIRLPHKNNWFSYYAYDWIRNTGFWKIIYFFQLLAGRTCQESYNSFFKKYLPAVLNKLCPDVVLVESGPTNLVSLVSEECVKRKIKYIIDFRDLYYHEMYLKVTSDISWTKSLKLYFERWYMKSSIKNASKIISLSQPLHDILGIPVEKRINIINGYDEKAWSDIAVEVKEDVFKIGVCGTLYRYDFLSDFLQSFKLFLEKNQDRVQLVFLAPGSDDIISRIKSHLPFPNVTVISQRISYKDSIRFMKSCTVLAYHGWPGYRGYASAKIYEYLRSGKKVLLVPGDQDILEDLVKETNAGVSFGDAESASNQLSKWYSEWKNGTLTSDQNIEKISDYSRQFQNKKLVSVVADLI